MQGKIISEAKWNFPDYDQTGVYFPSGLQAVYDIDGTRLAGSEPQHSDAVPSSAEIL